MFVLLTFRKNTLNISINSSSSVEALPKASVYKNKAQEYLFLQHTELCTFTYFSKSKVDLAKYTT